MSRCKVCGKEVPTLKGKYITITLWDCTEDFSIRGKDMYIHVECFQNAAGDDYLEDLKKGQV
jgi:hypothetical protein